MVKIRLKRMGAKKAPFYRIIVADSRSPRDGRFIEELGTYNPLTNPAEIKVDAERVHQWVKTAHSPPILFADCSKRPVFCNLWKTTTSKSCSLTLCAVLLQDPDAISVNEVEAGDTLTLQLRVAPDDMGKVIGRQGRIAKEIRALVKAYGLRDGRKVMVDILD